MNVSLVFLFEFTFTPALQAFIFIQTQTARKKENKHMRTYRNKPQFVGGDFSPMLSGKAFYDAGKAIGVSPWLGNGAFYTSVEAKKIAKTSNRKSDAYKKAYANLDDFLKPAKNLKSQYQIYS